jgi:hypothetical protein
MISVREQEQGDSIPRIIHQTYWTRDIPEPLRANAEALRTGNPGWDYRFYDDGDIERVIGECFGGAILACYRRIDPLYGAARADLFRYLALYRFGGVYLDIKSTSSRSLDGLLAQNSRFLLAKWDNGPEGLHPNWGLHPELEHIPGGELQQWHIVCVAGHPFLKAVIDSVLANIEAYRPWSHGVGRDGVIRLTGPIAYTLAITPLLGSHECRLYPNERAMGLEYSVVPGASHKQLLRNHYANNTASVVRMPGVLKFLASGYSLGKRTRRALGRLKRSIRG